MSASQDKKTRQEQRASGIDKKLAAKLEEERKRRKSNMKYTIVGIIVVVLIVVVLVFNSNLFNTAFSAVTVNGEKYNATEVNYFYYSNYYNFCNSNSSYIDYLIDRSKPLSQQDFSDEQTWDDYFKERAISSIKETEALYQAAVADGMTLSEESVAEIDEAFDSFTQYATANNLSLKQYLVAAYGRGSTEKEIRSLLEKSYLASQYSESILDGFTFTADEIDNYYAENADTYDYIEYALYFVATAADTEDLTEDEAAAAQEEALAQAEATAQEIVDAAGTTSETFTAAVTDITGGEAVVTAQQGANLSADYSAWLLDSARTSGDVTTVSIDGGCYALMFLSRDTNDYEMKAVRHILIKAQAEEDGTYTDEAKEEAKAKAEEIYNEWQSGEATEDSFAALAEEYSEDTGSNTNGGYYGDVSKHVMVQPFEDFCFNEGHVYGDTGIIFVESSNYTGYHIMFYIGDNGNFADYLAEAALRSDSYSQWETQLLDAVTVKETAFMRFVGN